jgi:uncharacterized membrane protein YtjA (UPF0391 family)
MRRPIVYALLAGSLGFVPISGAVGAGPCKPNLDLKEVRLSPIQPPSMERKWTAVVSVDASGCAANSAGYFEIVFVRSLEIGPEFEFREQFVWMPPSVKVGVDFGAYEAVERYRIDNITPCACRN